MTVPDFRVVGDEYEHDESRTATVNGLPIVFPRDAEPYLGELTTFDGTRPVVHFDELAFMEWLIESDLFMGVRAVVRWSAPGSDDRCYGTAFGLLFSVYRPNKPYDMAIEELVDDDEFAAWVSKLGLVEMFAEGVL